MKNVQKDLSQELVKVRKQIKKLSAEQVQLKSSKKLSKTEDEMADIQSKITLKRKVLALYNTNFNDLKSSLSQFPYGQSNLKSKITFLSQEIDSIKSIYQSLVFKQYQLKKALSIGVFSTVEAISEAQRDKKLNVLAINKATAKREALKSKYKELSDVLFLEEEKKAA